MKPFRWLLSDGGYGRDIWESLRVISANLRIASPLHLLLLFTRHCLVAWRPMVFLSALGYRSSGLMGLAWPALADTSKSLLAYTSLFVATSHVWLLSRAVPRRLRRQRPNTPKRLDGAGDINYAFVVERELLVYPDWKQQTT